MGAGESQMRANKGVPFALAVAMLLIFGSVTVRAAQQSGSSGSTDQTDTTSTTKKKAKKKACCG
jgi:hypothetical protein